MRDRAFKMGVANGVLFEVVMATSQPGTVLSAFVLRLTNSTFYATLPATLSSIGFLWPQLLVSNLAEARPHKKPIYVATSVVRAAMLALIALSTCWLAPEESRPSYIAFMNLLMAPAALVPLLAGALAELISFPAVFILSLVLGLGAQVLIRGLEEPRDRG